MAVPSGSGSEYLKAHYINNLSTTNTALITGVANKIYIILMINWCEMSGQENELINMKIVSGSDVIVLLDSQQIGPKGSFTWADKFCLSGAVTLSTYTNAAATIDVNISYLEQNWT